MGLQGPVLQWKCGVPTLDHLGISFPSLLLNHLNSVPAKIINVCSLMPLWTAACQLFYCLTNSQAFPKSSIISWWSPIIIYYPLISLSAFSLLYGGLFQWVSSCVRSDKFFCKFIFHFDFPLLMFKNWNVLFFHLSSTYFLYFFNDFNHRCPSPYFFLAFIDYFISLLWLFFQLWTSVHFCICCILWCLSTGLAENANFLITCYCCCCCC